MTARTFAGGVPGVTSRWALTNQPPFEPLTAPLLSEYEGMMTVKVRGPWTALNTSVTSCSRCSGPPNGVIARISSRPGVPVEAAGSTSDISKLRSNASQSAGQFWPAGGLSVVQLLHGKHGDTRSTTRFTLVKGPPVSCTLAVAVWKSGFD